MKINALVRVFNLVRSRLQTGLTAAERIYREFAETDDFSGVIFDMESFAQPLAPLLKGRIHDLGDSFARIKAAYFNNAMPRPNLVWNRTLTARKFGHYQRSRDTVMILVTLDDSAVSQHAIDFVMYHELPHKNTAPPSSMAGGNLIRPLFARTVGVLPAMKPSRNN